MTPMFKPTTLALALVSALALSGCPQQERPDQPAADAVAAAATPAAATLKIDESTLPPVNHFAMSDLDTSKNACADFGGYVNGKWLAGNEIPGDRSSWGAFDMLAERSLAVRHQLAEQAAADKNAKGVEKIVGDFYATGMDQAKVDALGITPLQGRLDEIAALTDKSSIAGYLRTSAARGEGYLFGFGPEADFKNSSMNFAYATQGGLGLPDRGYYFDKDKHDKLVAYQAHVAKVLELSGVPAADAAKQAKSVVSFETRLAKA